MLTVCMRTELGSSERAGGQARTHASEEGKRGRQVPVCRGIPRYIRRMKVILYTIEWKRKVQEKDGSGGGHTGTVA